MVGLPFGNASGRLLYRLFMRPVDERIRAKHGAERKAWRVWRACWFGIYAVVTAALVGIGSLSIKPTEAERAETSKSARPSATSSELTRANIAATDRAASC
jgi:hypothetical protein